MTISERVAYVKGLAEGMKLDNDSNEGKLFNAILDVLNDISEEIDAIYDDQLDIAEQLDAVDEDLSAIEELIYDDEECSCCDCDDCDDDIYEVTCPNCNDTIYIDSEMLEEEGIKCPNCGTDLEFDFECECECGCDECNTEE